MSSGVLGPSVGPGSLYSPATEILSFFLGSFEVVVEGFLPPTAGRSFIGGTSACSGPLLRVTAISLAFGLATVVVRCGGGFRAGKDGRLSSPPSGVADGDVSCTLDALCIDRNLFPVNTGLF